jgi:hypothetical protein
VGGLKFEGSLNEAYSAIDQMRSETKVGAQK